MHTKVISMDLWAITKINLIGWQLINTETSPSKGFPTLTPFHQDYAIDICHLPSKVMRMVFLLHRYSCGMSYSWDSQGQIDQLVCFMSNSTFARRQRKEHVGMWGWLCHSGKVSAAITMPLWFHLTRCSSGPFHPVSLKACQPLIHLTEQSVSGDRGKHAAAFPWRTGVTSLSHLNKRCFRRRASGWQESGVPVSGLLISLMPKARQLLPLGCSSSKDRGGDRISPSNWAHWKAFK